MKKEDVLIIIETDPARDIFFNDWVDRGYNAAVIFKKVSKPLRAIRRYWIKYNLPFVEIWLGKWFKRLENYKSIIIHMSSLTRYLPFLITKKYPNINIKCWYWNTIDETNLPILTHNSNIEYYSFDKNDCAKYGMNFNIQYYCYQKNRYNNSKKDYDVYFIGFDKNRKDKILKFKEIAVAKGLNCNIEIIDSVEKAISYEENKKNISKTKAILDINKDEQLGLTLRVLESLFFEVKLITNNLEVKKEEFYNRNNIFLIGEDNYDKLNDFINSAYDKNVNIYKKDYELEKWFNNFYN